MRVAFLITGVGPFGGFAGLIYYSGGFCFVLDGEEIEPG